MTENPEFEYINSVNRPVLALDDFHPAKKFLLAFIECRSNCVGRELGQFEPPIDQEWKSTTDGKQWTFSGFAYTILSFDIELDGFLEDASYLTPSEMAAEQELPVYRVLMRECADAAQRGGNTEILELTDEVLKMISLWEEYLSYRKEAISRSQR